MNDFAAAQRQRMDLVKRKVTSKRERRKQRPPALPEFPHGVGLATAQVPGVNYFEKFKEDLQKRKLNHDQRRKVLRDISERERRLMQTLAPDPLALDSRICGSCLLPMADHPKPDYYPCPTQPNDHKTGRK